MKKIIRFCSYPVVFGMSAVVVILAINHTATAWPWFATITALALWCIARLERVQPYQEKWVQNDWDLSADIA